MVYDIGANIGVYTILAARQAGPNGKVYAFEPHAANFTRLIDNVIRNNLQDVVIPCSVALDAEAGFSHFNYDSANAGTSNSQFSADSGGAMQPHGSEIAELKYATSIDRLMESGRIAPPHHIKIDVDGNEHRILQGMTRLLGSSAAPLTIQVELNEPHTEEILAFLQAHHIHLDQKALHALRYAPHGTNGWKPNRGLQCDFPQGRVTLPAPARSSRSQTDETEERVPCLLKRASLKRAN